LGALVGGGKKSQIEAIYRYGKCVGLLFQIVDDLLDGEGYASLLGAADTKKLAENLCLRAKNELVGFGAKAKNLNQLADFILERKS
jgi:geranylgeranyl pyrophosphate synthase